MGFDDGNWVILDGFTMDYMYICLVMQVGLGVCEFGKIGN